MFELSLLLVEDNDDDRFLTIRQLKKLPFALTVAVAKNGEEAIKLIPGEEPGRHSLPSVILLDLQLPKISGISLLTRIREKYTTSELPVIILSSSDNPGDIALSRELGINGYLSKPLDLAQLAEILTGLFPLAG